MELSWSKSYNVANDQRPQYNALPGIGNSVLFVSSGFTTLTDQSNFTTAEAIHRTLGVQETENQEKVTLKTITLSCLLTRCFSGEGWGKREKESCPPAPCPHVLPLRATCAWRPVAPARAARCERPAPGTRSRPRTPRLHLLPLQLTRSGRPLAPRLAPACRSYTRPPSLARPHSWEKKKSNRLVFIIARGGRDVGRDRQQGERRRSVREKADGMSDRTCNRTREGGEPSDGTGNRVREGGDPSDGTGNRGRRRRGAITKAERTKGRRGGPTPHRMEERDCVPKGGKRWRCGYERGGRRRTGRRRARSAGRP
uniref:Uncharacterized protein n=1 Tax=Ananas comosus var. bracteatus TaxID=296719 RepID=A0A6V7PS09_ANACO|nr:unnamed protein product [Ananas comosus var. bracteatus]